MAECTLTIIRSCCDPGKMVTIESAAMTFVESFHEWGVSYPEPAAPEPTSVTLWNKKITIEPPAQGLVAGAVGTLSPAPSTKPPINVDANAIGFVDGFVGNIAPPALEPLPPPPDESATIAEAVAVTTTALLEDNEVRSNALHAKPRLSLEQLAADLYYGNHTGALVPPDQLDNALRSRLSEEQYAKLGEELDELRARDLGSVQALAGDNGNDIEIGGDLDAVSETAAQLYEDNKIGEPYGGSGHRLNENEIAYQLEEMARSDPGQALAVKMMLDGLLAPNERAELNRVLATGGSFSEKIDLAFSHPLRGLEGAGKGTANGVLDLVEIPFDLYLNSVAGIEDLVSNGGVGVPRGTTGGGSTAGQMYVPDAYDFVKMTADAELEIPLNGRSEEGGAIVAQVFEVAWGGKGLIKPGISIAKIGGEYFLRNGDELIARFSDDAARQLDEGVDALDDRVIAALDETPGNRDAATPGGIESPNRGYDPERPPERISPTLDANPNVSVSDAREEMVAAEGKLESALERLNAAEQKLDEGWSEVEWQRYRAAHDDIYGRGGLAEEFLDLSYEQRAIDTMRQHGYDIEFLTQARITELDQQGVLSPHINPTRNPESFVTAPVYDTTRNVVVEGRVLDVHTPKTVGSAWGTALDKVNGGQADGVIINLARENSDGQPVVTFADLFDERSISDYRDFVADARAENLRELWIIDEGGDLHAVPLNLYSEGELEAFRIAEGLIDP